jgi:hypothetical protein
VIVGLNRILSHAGKDYHLQVEDLGVEVAAFDVRVYDGGSIAWRKRVSYADLVQRALPREELERELHAMMEKTLHTLEAAVVKGKLT